MLVYLFTKMYCLTDFKDFVLIIFLIFNAIGPLYSYILSLCDPSFSQNLRSDYLMKYIPPDPCYNSYICEMITLTADVMLIGSH